MPIYPELGGEGSLAGIPAYSVFADPNGNDSFPGTANAPFRTLYAAALNVIGQGGGTVNFNDNTPVGGPVTNQGLWLRNDGVSVPGFIDISNSPLRFVGNGQSSGNYVFERPGSAQIDGGGTHLQPVIWIVGSEVPIDFQYIKVGLFGSLQGVPSPVRLGWDYVRKTDGTINWLPVDAADRTDGSSVYTIDISACDPFTITHADRDVDDVVTLTLTRPLTVAMSPWVIGAHIRVDTGGDTDFPDVDAVVTGQSDVLNLSSANTTITVQYVQSGATTAKDLSGTVKSHGMVAGDYLTTDFSNAEFPTVCQMSVTAATIDTVTVFDPYGYDGRSASASEVDIGNVVKQLRGREVASSVSIELSSIIGYVGGATDTLTASPAIDLGGTSAADLYMSQVYITGGNAWNWPDFPDNYDPSRTQVAILADPGGSTLSGSSFQAYNCQSQSGHVIFNPQDTEAHVYVNYWLQDSAMNALPTVVCGNGTTFASVQLKRIGQADADQAAITIGTGYDPLKVEIGAFYSASDVPIENGSGIVGPTNARGALWNGAFTPIESPWKLGWKTIWPGGLSTHHPGPNWAMGPMQSRLQNTFQGLSAWQTPVSFPAGITVTQDGLAPDGSSTAYKIVNANGGNTTFKIGAYPIASTFSTGDGVAFGTWMKQGGQGGQLQLSSYNGDETLFDGSSIIRLERYVLTNGWQWVSAVARAAQNPAVPPVAPGAAFVQYVAPPGTSYLWCPTLLRSAAGDIVDDEWYEFGNNFRAQPIYLTPGMSGTMAGTGFVADGGLTVGLSGYASGTVAMFDGASAAVSASGSAALRYNSGTNKIQYSKNGGAWTDLV